MAELDDPEGELESDRAERIGIDLGSVFTPAAPIDSRRLFSGRTRQLRDVIDAINQRGQHAIIFGERGVGKTSLASVLEEYLPTAGSNVIAPKVTCDGTDNFSRVWRKVFGGVQFVVSQPGMGLRAEAKETIVGLAETLPENVKPHDIELALRTLAANAIVIIIIDEFDRVTDEEDRALFADTIKTLSDQGVRATLVLVGVAESVEQLIHEHLSIERALVQIRMPRMSTDELNEIVEKGLEAVGMTIHPDALARITLLSHGLPHYTHLLALLAARNAVDFLHPRVTATDVAFAERAAVERAQQSIVTAYHHATMSSRSDHLYKQVLLASALAPCDELGYFSAGDVRRPLSLIMAKKYDTPAFARHLNDFCGVDRGPILERIEEGRRVRFRFINPLMQPFVTLQGLTDGMVPDELLVDE